MATQAKCGDPCPHCGKGKLDLSASGKQLVCTKCSRIVLVSPIKKRHVGKGGA